MIELRGKYNTAKVFTNNIENSAISQLITLLNQEFVKDSQIRIMPDCHSGSGCVIGTTMTLHDKVIPNLVGVDIGCGMLAVKLKEKRIDFPNLDSVIRKYVPSGAEVHSKTNEDRTALRVEELKCFGKPNANIRADLAYQSVGTLGGGNHFIEVDKDTDGNLWLVVHTGSRHIGLEICRYYQNLAYEKIKQQANGGTRKEKVDALIEKLKSEGRQKDISKEIAKFNKEYKEQNPLIPHELAYVEGDDFKDYIHDMDMVQRHAVCNRAEIARVIMKYANLHEVERFETIHNYIDTENMILRKGSVSAQAGEKLIVPMNMRDGSLICIGKGNPDWNYSAPHGAGRLMSRSKAKENISMEEFKRTMEEAGIYSTSVNRSTLDESPMAYKPMEEIIENIKDTVDIVNVIKPIYNFKAAEIEKDLSKDFSITGELQKEDEYDFDR